MVKDTRTALCLYCIRRKGIPDGVGGIGGAVLGVNCRGCGVEVGLAIRAYRLFQADELKGK